MPTSTTNYGLIKPGTDDPILVGQLNDNMDTIDTVLKDHSDKIDAAALGIKYKGEVNYYADLPNNAEIGDAYTVKYAGSSGTTPDGTEYVWGTVSGTNQWINFSKDSYTKAEVDALLSLKANIADIPTPSTAAPAMDGTAAAGTSTDYARADHVHPSDTSKQDALTTAQLAAANSGIDSAKVEQIETNKNNILAIQTDMGVPPISNTTTLANYAGTLAKGYHTAFIVNGQNPSDSPVSDNCFVDFFVYSANTAEMRVFPTYSTYAGEFYVRTKVSGSWGAWYKFQGTAVN